jgi:hypothetical protein
VLIKSVLGVYRAMGDGEVGCGVGLRGLTGTIGDFIGFVVKV